MELARRGSGGEGLETAKRSGETLGVLAAILSSSVGGVTTAVTRYVIGATDPATLAGMRFGLGFLLLLPIALTLRSRWPNGRDWLGVALLGILFFAVFFGLFNLALKYTSAARGALAVSTLPVMTMLIASALRVERLSPRKSVGVAIAIAGVAVALVGGLRDAPPGAWRCDAIMVGATLCFALYSILFRALQHMVASVHRAIELFGIRHGRHGIRLARHLLPCLGRRRLCEHKRLRRGTMDRGRLSRRLRRGADVLSLGVCARPHDADESDEHDHAQSRDRVDRRDFPGGRADRSCPPRGHRGGLHGNPGRVDREVDGSVGMGCKCASVVECHVRVQRESASRRPRPTRTPPMIASTPRRARS